MGDKQNLKIQNLKRAGAHEYSILKRVKTFLPSYKHYNWINERFSSAESQIKTNYKFLILFTDKNGYTS